MHTPQTAVTSCSAARAVSRDECLLPATGRLGVDIPFRQHLDEVPVPIEDRSSCVSEVDELGS
jgi:hypothetical protein